VFLNKKGREAEGVVAERDYEPVRDELKQALESERDKNGSPWKTKVYRPEELYDNPQGELPDLMVYLDDLSYRSAGTVGHKKLYLDENDTGPDDAVHNWDGVFIFWNKNRDIKQKAMVNLDSINVLDIYRIVIENLGI
jgi:predicted AlkP superfamily phosphohydrolase/phosphomutase